ncbi:MAG: CPBP family intramembrane metalloprotease [Solobacterium sp.]|nr:CPBP family intramembrane metalloprotease [Solobacterium sp.]
MRLFLYYAAHSTFNQLRKLFKSWVLIFIIVCGLIGGLIGFGAALLSEEAGFDDEPEEIVIPVPETPEITPADDGKILGIEWPEAVELAAGAIVLSLFAFEAISADKNGSKIFLPADVTLLFSSPMKPQSVLLFRLGTQVGTMLMGSIYLLFQIPNLVINLHLSLTSVLAVFAAWFMTLIISKFLQILVYTLTSTYPRLRRPIISGIYALLAAAAGGFFLYTKLNGLSLVPAAASFFNNPVSRLIPFWGWIKGFCVSAVTGQTIPALLYLAATLAGSILLVWVIWHIKADFYEDAMAKSEEIAEMMSAMQSEGGSYLIKRSKDRSETLVRDGMKYGSGASVFFFKTMYNRWRFSFLHFFTKTTGFYLFAAMTVSVFVRFIADSSSMIPAGIALAVICFFRTLGNPLNQDAKTDSFRMIPESTWKKLLYSMLGGTASCVLDLIPAVVVSALIVQADPLEALIWIPVIASIDFYATSASMFIDVSIPEAIGKTIKSVILVMFVYFGMLPDAAVTAVGMAFGHTYLGVLAAIIVNIYLGSLFFCLAPIFIEPQGGRRVPFADAGTSVIPAARKTFSLSGFALAVMLAGTTALQLVLLKMPLPEGLSAQAVIWLTWLKNFLPIYLFGVPLLYLILRRIPVTKIRTRKLAKKYYILLPLMCLFLMYAGNLIGSLITLILSLLFKSGSLNPVQNLVTGSSVWTTLVFAVILAPIMEELVFRKLLIDRIHIYGEKTAILVSAFTFGLFHGNFSQFFYAAALGALWAYVYIKTGKLRYTIGMHMFVNFFGGIAGPQLTQKAMLSLPSLSEMKNTELSAFLTPEIIFFTLYLILLIGCVLAGFAVLCMEAAKAQIQNEAQELPKKGRFRTVWINAGMILFLAGCTTLFVMSVL